ncbi:hypothetical protein FRB90_011527 [Tulasnella sp. 427]|nr:hypothetical protein FRB90_011527 [Tulasnella sp. 427]
MLTKPLAVLSALVVAQFASAALHEVTVGGSAGLVFTPNQVTGAVEGDVIHFIFQAKNHTATQSSFDKPCQQISKGGFDSGFQPVDDGTTNFPTYDLAINGTDPVWVYCAQATHCQSGMVFAVNAPTDGKTFDRFMANAMGASPMSMSTAMTDSGMSMPGTSAVSSATTSAAAVASTATKNAAGRGSGSLIWGTLSGLVLGGMAGAAIAV